jgi:hypothetical protein
MGVFGPVQYTEWSVFVHKVQSRSDCSFVDLKNVAGCMLTTGSCVVLNSNS